MKEITIKDIARQCGVSIATVSHVINSTRYVSPELADRVIQIIKETNYKKNIGDTVNFGKRSQIAFLVPCFEDYAVLADVLSGNLSRFGYTVSVLITNDNINTEKQLLTASLGNKSTAGIILAPVADNSGYYETILNRTIPFVLTGQFLESNEIDSVTTNHELALYKSAAYLIQCGHDRIVLMTGKKESSLAAEQIAGYRRALEANHIPYRPELVLTADRYQEDMARQLLCDFYEKAKPTALISGVSRFTPGVLRFLDDHGIEYPKHLSFIGFGSRKWTELVDPPVTIIDEDFEAIGSAVTARILDKIAGNTAREKTGASPGIMPVKKQRIQTGFLLRKSTQMIGRGPFGEEAIPIERLALSEKEIEDLRNGHFKIAISFHYGNTAWTRLHENGIRDTLEKYGVRILSITEAHFNPELQVTQLEGLRMQKPDAIIAIPSDDVVTAAKFKELAEEIKLIFISNVPSGMEMDKYASCVSINEREGGYNAGVLLGEYFKNRDKVHIGFISHGAPFYGTHLRDGTAEQVVRENYPNIDIVSVKYFHKIECAYDVCREMLGEHPEIEGLYVSWDAPALQAIRALKEIHREDAAIFTCDLDVEIGAYLAKGEMVRGLVAQRPYVQGTAVGLATAKALLGEGKYKYIGVSPYVVRKSELRKAWEDIFHIPAPGDWKLS
ncbi:MAG: LacI family DNA-binding transcriptional regulator [Treponema sp.]|jgi:ribose transport system substrate-binding protein|nr:LacI family DNA-binding transcriptional regulator [Treponema sp.]